MSISAIVINDEYKDLNIYIPIATEKVFYEYWKPEIDSLNLKYLNQIQYGIEINISNKPLFVQQLKELYFKINKSYKGNNIYLSINKRIKFVIEEVNKLFKNYPNIILYIG